MPDRLQTTPSTWRRGFWSLMGTQFQNAFSDLALKTLVVFLVLARPMPQSERDMYVAFAGFLFGAPFLLFSMFGGWLADRFSKQRVMSAVKMAEVGIMLFAALALGWRSLYLELAALFLMGCHSAIFGPSKYGILPEILPLEKLSWGNGLLELLTFLGIILGTVAGGWMAQHLKEMPYVAGLTLAILAVAGWGVSRGITHVDAANPSCPPRINPVVDLLRQLRLMRPDRDLWRANWGNMGFWFVATLVQMNLMLYAKDILKLSEEKNGLLNAALAIGIGIGSALAGILSRGRIQYGLVPLGAVGIALATVPMGSAGIGIMGFSASLVALGLAAGFFIVPIAAVLQHRPPPEAKGAVQGAANLMSFIGIVAVSGAQILLNNILHVPPARIFWLCGAMALLTGLYAVSTRREAFRQLVQSFKSA